MEEITLMSFGLLYGLPEQADTVIGTRGLPNPYYVDALKHQTGLEQSVRDHVFSTPEAEAYFASCLALVRQRITLYQSYDSPLKEPLLIAVGCSGGHHRSVSVTHRLAQALREEGIPVQVVHRDLNKKLEHSAGAVVYTLRNGSVQYAIIQSLLGHHGFPKGHMEAGETEKETAVREIREEIGVDVRLLPAFRSVELYPLPKNSNTYKQVVFFLAQAGTQTLRPQRTELRTAVWMPFTKALQTLEYDDDRRVLSEANKFLMEQHGLS
ncbi:MAG: NUDIX domain-containing protein [Oscillospiraceae bacterium]|nr:NUDIX domain-containing protein [Oscillospiraceae bacterium]